MKRVENKGLQYDVEQYQQYDFIKISISKNIMIIKKTTSLKTSTLQCAKFSFHK